MVSSDASGPAAAEQQSSIAAISATSQPDQLLNPQIHVLWPTRRSRAPRDPVPQIIEQPAEQRAIEIESSASSEPMPRPRHRLAFEAAADVSLNLIGVHPEVGVHDGACNRRGDPAAAGTVLDDYGHSDLADLPMVRTR